MTVSEHDKQSHQGDPALLTTALNQYWAWYDSRYYAVNWH